jgi:lactate permease
MTWQHNYDPLGNLFLSTAVAGIPVILLLALLAIWHVRAHWAALAGLASAVALAVGVYHMPAPLTFAAAGYGAAFGLFPIGWIVLNAIFIYEISVTTGQFEVLKRQVAGLARDRRLQTLLIAFSFGAFIEGAAGFGAPVAITGALMIGLGFKPLEAAKLALIGNTAPVAFGSLGIPLVTLSKVTGLDVNLLSQTVGRQLPPFAILVPFLLIFVQSGWRGMLQVWPACLVTGLSFGIMQFLMSNFHGPLLVDLVASLTSMAALIALLRFWQPPVDEKDNGAEESSVSAEHAPVCWRTGLRAWIPWITLSVLVFAWTSPAVKDALNHLSSPKWPVPLLDHAVVRMPPVVPKPTPEEAVYKFEWLAATGTALFLSGWLSGLILGVSPWKLLQLYVRTVLRVRLSLFTIAVMLALGYTTRFSGSDTTMGLTFALTKGWFPFFSPLLGWLGVALTGSDTSSNVLFGNLQQVTAQQLGISPILTASANSAGGVMGKMIDAQSIVVASIAVGGRDRQVSAGEILRQVFIYSIALAILVGLWVTAMAYLFPGLIPVAK